jgi:hypothetical protein
VQTSKNDLKQVPCAGLPCAMRLATNSTIAVLVLISATGAWAQAPKVDSAEAAAAMERAQRSAANPMRAILQASRINTTVRVEAPAAAPRVAAAPQAAAAATAVTVTPLALALAANAAPTLPVAAATPSVTSFVKPAEVFYKADSRLNTTGANQVQALEAPVAVVAVAEQLSAASPSATLVNSVITPKLKHRVDPALPQNVLDQIGQVRDVRVNMNIQADGSVSDVAVQQPVPRQIVRYVQAAVAQWQFEPLPAPRAHTVQLVFSAE